jgi:FeS assembly SUF system regulator
MLHLSKLADYATVIMSQMAVQQDTAVSAASLAESLGIPLPTVAKLLKLLAKGGLLVSVRGGKGGYLLSRNAAAISLADVIAVIDGTPGLTQCISAPGTCQLESQCGMRNNWSAINQVVIGALAGVSLAQTGASAAVPLRNLTMR